MHEHEEIRRLLQEMKEGLAHHRELGFDPPPVKPFNPAAKTEEVSGSVEEALPSTGSQTLEDLRNELGDCRRCKLHLGRKHLVFGEGNPQTELVFVGEGPGHEEDLSGRPFVGAAGELLTKIIGAMGLTREMVYICNVVKCRPPRNRDPEKDEVEACLPFLRRQLAILRPKAICVLGRVAGQSLLGPGFRISASRGRWYDFEGVPLLPTFHPAYLLRNVSAKRLVWEDVQKIMGHLGLEVRKNG